VISTTVGAVGSWVTTYETRGVFILFQYFSWILHRVVSSLILVTLIPLRKLDGLTAQEMFSTRHTYAQNTGCMLAKRTQNLPSPTLILSHSQSTNPGWFTGRYGRPTHRRCGTWESSAVHSRDRSQFLSCSSRPLIIPQYFRPLLLPVHPGRMGSLADSEGLSFQGMAIPRTAAAQPFDMARRKCSSWPWR
jgi:hypothetical protein